MVQRTEVPAGNLLDDSHVLIKPLLLTVRELQYWAFLNVYGTKIQIKVIVSKCSAC